MPLNAQINDSTNNYFNIVAVQDAYYDSLLLIRGADSMEGTGFKQYQRWKNFVGLRVDENGGLNNYINAVNNYYLSSNPVVSNYTWQYSGPKGLFNHLVAGAGKGWVNRILVDEAYPGKILAGTHNSGLWYTGNGGIDWNLITSKEPRITGIASMCRSNDGSGSVYLATAANMTSYSNGLYKLTDNGSSWESVDIDKVDVKVDGTDIYPSSFVGNIPRKLMESPTSNTLYLLTNYFLYKSTDNGETWVEILESAYNPDNNDDDGLEFWNGERFNDMLIDNRDENTIYIGGHRIFKTIDAGVNWVDITLEVTGVEKINFYKMYNHTDLDTNDPNNGDAWFFSKKLEADDLTQVRIDKFDWSEESPYENLYMDEDLIYANDYKVAFKVDPLNETLNPQVIINNSL